MSSTSPNTQSVRLKSKSKKSRVRREPLPERRASRWESFTDWARDRASVITIPIARIVARWGVHPNTLTIVGLLLQIGVAAVFASGRIVLGGWLLLVVAPIDALDGALARASGKQSRFGAFLDSTLDRVADAVLILGLTAHYLRAGDFLTVTLLLVSLVAVMLVSYIRARAEAIGLPCKVGLLTRMERILLIGVLCALGWAELMAWILMALSLFTVGQRILYIYAASRRLDAEEVGPD
jgi:CDP-diacylglycerol--glycerol-3-phosphate 3-phosphatidyltransferase